MSNITHRVGINASVDDVYNAIATVDGVAGWWTVDTSGESRIGNSMSVRFTKDDVEIGSMAMTVTTMTPGMEVQWRVTDGPPEWIGTDITFSLSQQDGITILLFGHRNWRDAGEFMAHCSMKWATFLLSLRDFAETGTGRPSPRDLKIDNWN